LRWTFGSVDAGRLRALRTEAASFFVFHKKDIANGLTPIFLRGNAQEEIIIRVFVCRRDKNVFLQPNFEQIEVKDMLIIPVKEGESIERSLKKFKRKFEKTGAMRDLRNRKQYVKPSVGRRKEVKKAVYVQGLRLEDEG